MAYQKAYRLEHRERIKLYCLTWRRDPKNKEHVKAFLEANAEHILDLRRARYKRNPEPYKAAAKGYRLRNDEVVRERQRLRSKRLWDADPEAGRAKGRAYYARNKDKSFIRAHRRRARKIQAGGSFSLGEWRELKKRYNHTCLGCGREEKETGTLHADHIQPLCRGGSNFIENIQPLCRTCNLKKGRHTMNYRIEAA